MVNRTIERAIKQLIRTMKNITRCWQTARNGQSPDEQEEISIEQIVSHRSIVSFWMNEKWVCKFLLVKHVTRYQREKVV